MSTNIKVTANLAIIGNVSPYSYQVKPKTWNRESSSKQVVFNGVASPSRLTKGQGKGANVRFYIYFMDADFQHWIELTAATHAELTKNPAAVLELTKADAAPVASPAEPAAETPVANKRAGRRASRETAAA